MPLTIIRADISKLKVDAIVNPTDIFCSGSGGTDLLIHQAAGPALRAELDLFGELLPVGKSRISGAGNLPCRHVIHTSAPIWTDGCCGEEEKLRSCYLSALQLALEHDCKSIAFPIISAGSFGFPKDLALRAATDSIRDFLLEQDMQVYLAVYNKELFHISEKLYGNIQDFISRNYTDFDPLYTVDDDADFYPPLPVALSYKFSYCSAPAEFSSLEEQLDELDESFSQMLLRKIDERGIKDSQCYKRANIDKRVFSKIRSNPNYKPSKPTALAFAIALELDLEETRELLLKAGYALSRSSKFDVIVEYFIREKNYDIFEINNVLYEFDQNLLGSV